MANDDELARLLASIDRRLALLTESQERDLRATLRDELLKTPARIAMFEGIDGQRGSGELSKGNGTERCASGTADRWMPIGLSEFSPEFHWPTVGLGPPDPLTRVVRL